VTQKQQTVHNKLLTDNGQTVEDSSGHSDRQPMYGRVYGSEREWTDFETAVDTVTPSQKTVHCGVLRAIEQTVEISMNAVTQIQQNVKCTDLTVCVDDFRSQQWTQ